MGQLPVQKILSFTQPAASVAAAYTSAICWAEGTRPDEHFFTLRAGSGVDLRRCINQCQLGTSPRPPGTTDVYETSRSNWEDVLEKSACFPQWDSPLRDESECKTLFRCLAIHANNISYLDSRLVLRVDTVSESVVFANPQTLMPFSPQDWSNPSSADDELGYTILPTGDLTSPEFTHCHHDVELAKEILSLTARLSSRAHSTKSSEIPGGSSSDTGLALGDVHLDLTSSNHRLWMNRLATDLSVIPPFNQRLFLEYESVVREMIVADDYVEASIAAAQVAEAAECGQSGRQTRNSQRLKAGFYRYLDLVPDRKNWLVRTAFGGRTI